MGCLCPRHRRRADLLREMSRGMPVVRTTLKYGRSSDTPRRWLGWLADGPGIGRHRAKVVARIRGGHVASP